MSSDDLSTMENLKIGDDYQTYKLGNFKLKSGAEIPDAYIAYKTLGDPSLPAVIYPTWYSGRTTAPLQLTVLLLTAIFCSDI